jgi:preprotein translocase subunit SecE
MATIGKQPATQPPAPNKATRQATTAAVNTRPRFIDRQRENIRNIMAELRKVTWPTREETRNLTIVVIGISVVLGTVLATLDALFAVLYRLVNP